MLLPLLLLFFHLMIPLGCFGGTRQSVCPWLIPQVHAQVQALRALAWPCFPAFSLSLSSQPQMCVPARRPSSSMALSTGGRDGSNVFTFHSIRQTFFLEDCPSTFPPGSPHLSRFGVHIYAVLQSQGTGRSSFSASFPLGGSASWG